MRTGTFCPYDYFREGGDGGHLLPIQTRRRRRRIRICNEKAPSPPIRPTCTECRGRDVAHQSRSSRGRSPGAHWIQYEKGCGLPRSSLQSVAYPCCLRPLGDDGVNRLFSSLPYTARRVGTRKAACSSKAAFSLGPIRTPLTLHWPAVTLNAGRRPALLM